MDEEADVTYIRNNSSNKITLGDTSLVVNLDSSVYYQ